MEKGGGDGEKAESERKRRLIGAGTYHTLGSAALCDRNVSGFDYIHGVAGFAFENNVLSSFVASDPVVNTVAARGDSRAEDVGGTGTKNEQTCTVRSE